MKKKTPTQCDQILKFMATHKRGITALQAIKHCGCLNLKGRIWDLKRQGYKITGERVEVVKANGQKARVMQYKLME